MARIVAPVLGTPVRNFGAVIVGTGDVWADNSAATYVYSPPGNSADPGWGEAPATLPRAIPDVPALASYARLKIDLQVAGHAPGVTLNLPGFGNIGGTDTGAAPRHEAGGVTWVPLAFTTDVSSWATAGAVLNVLVGYEGFTSPYAWNIYEVSLVFEIPDDAPPCRIFPRRDGLGVGAGVAYPPSKSQQRSPSNRGVGYY